MNNEKLIVNNKESNVVADIVPAQKNKNQYNICRGEHRSSVNNAIPVGASLVGIPKRHDTTVAEKRNKANQGITLISLIITIIIMLILAGIVLNLAIGERGIFNTAKNASKEYEIERIKEKVNLEILDLSSQKLAKEEKLTVEEALIGIQEKEVFEEIDLRRRNRNMRRLHYKTRI